jgi:putative DNA primase/helicase
MPLPLKTRDKNPQNSIGKGWEKFKITEADIEQHFNCQPQNVGVLLGKPSDWLVDADLDVPEAVETAQVYLPTSYTRFGRKGNPNSHHLYRCPGLKTKQFSFNRKEGGKNRSTMIMELRSTGTQTVMPGSLHDKTGERITWHEQDAPQVVDAEDLLHQASRAAAAALLARYWPAAADPGEHGCRHFAALALAGGLARAGWDQESAELFVETVCTVGGCEDIKSKVACVAGSIEKHRAGEQMSGWPKLSELIGIDVVKTATNWLGIKPGKATAEDQLVVRCAADIETKPIKWFWDQRIPADSISLLIGMPNAGKSTWTMDIAARVSVGASWPIGDDQTVPFGSVLILSAEDGAEQIVVPRLRAAMADLTKVHIVEAVKRDGKRSGVDVATDAGLIARLMDELGDVKLIIVDPLDSYIGGNTDIFRGNEARAALWPLKDLAEQRGVTVLIAHHFNKTPSTNAIDRVSGARSFGALPRSVWIAAADDENPEANRTILAPAKWNMSRRRPSAVAYTMEPSQYDPDIACIKWEQDEIDIAASDLMARQASQDNGDPSALDEASAFLEMIMDGGDMPSSKVYSLAKDRGITRGTLRRAKDVLGYKIVPAKDEAGKVTGWTWTGGQP